MRKSKLKTNEGKPYETVVLEISHENFESDSPQIHRSISI